VAIKNSIDVFYFSCLIPMHVLFTEDGEMDKRVFLATWKDIPVQNEVQYEISNVQHNAGLCNNALMIKAISCLLFSDHYQLKVVIYKYGIVLYDAADLFM